MRSIVLEGKTLFAYEALRQRDKAAHKKLVKILKEIMRGDPARGIGKPELLKENYSGLWSRRLSKKDRLIYKYDAHQIHVLVIGGHYDAH